MKTNDEYWMRRALQLAGYGQAGAAPNPMVGAVIVCDGRIIGEGYHARCGEGHAEVNALESVSAGHRRHLSESTIYVTLEPCAHEGRTPSCARRLVREGIGRVVVGSIDNFAQVSGRGIEILREAGVQVTVGVLEEECRSLNRPFFTANALHRPYVTLKWARSADGFIDRLREEHEEAARLSSPESLLRVHRLRAESDAILVGRRTLETDRPSLTVRHWAGRTPLKCVLGHPACLPEGFEAFGNIPALLTSLCERGCHRLLVEGGAKVHQSFISAGLWDEAHEEISPLLLHDGVPAPALPPGTPMRQETVWGHLIFRYTNPRPAGIKLATDDTADD